MGLVQSWDYSLIVEGLVIRGTSLNWGLGGTSFLKILLIQCLEGVGWSLKRLLVEEVGLLGCRGGCGDHGVYGDCYGHQRDHHVLICIGY